MREVRSRLVVTAPSVESGQVCINIPTKRNQKKKLDWLCSIGQEVSRLRIPKFESVWTIGW